MKSTELVYLFGSCGAFQAGQFGLGQAVDYRVNGGRLYIRRDDGKEYKCKNRGQKTLQDAQTVAPPAKP